MSDIKKEKPSSESISSLTKPQLFGFYDDDVVQVDEINELKTILSISSAVKEAADEAKSQVHRTKSQLLLKYIMVIIVLSLSGIVYHSLSVNIHDNHQLHENFASRPLLVGVKISQLLSFNFLPSWLSYSLEGILFGLITPIIDYLSNVKPRTTSLFSILKATNAMMGITFGIRKIEWASSLQASSSWGLLNIILWLFFDGSRSLLINSIVVSLVACISCVDSIHDVSQFLYFMDFYFLGLMIFGKLGRYLVNY